MSVCDQGEVRGEHRDVVVGELDAESAAELLDGRLAHGVRDGAHAVDEREHRADQDDLATVGDDLLQPGGDGVGDAGDVDRQRGLDVRGRGVAQRRGLREQAGVGDHDVEPAEPVDGLGDRGVERRRGRERLRRSRRPWSRAGLAARAGVEGSMSTIATLRAPVEQFAASGGADAAVAAGDEDDLVGQVVGRAAHATPRRGLSETRPLRRTMAATVRSAPRSRSGSCPRASRCSWSVFQLRLSTPSRVFRSATRPIRPAHADPDLVGVEGGGTSLEDRVGRVGGGHRRARDADHVAVPRGERVLHPGAGAEPAGDRERDGAGRVADRARIVEEVGLTRSRGGRGRSGHGRRLVVAAADLDQVHGLLGERGDDGTRVVLAESAALEVGGVELHRHREARAHPGPHPSYDLDEEPHPARRVAAPLVVTQVRQRREELGDEVAVGGVELHPVEAGGLTHRGSRREAIDDVLDLDGRELAGHGRAGKRQRHGAGRDRRVPDVQEVGLTAGVVQLREDRRSTVVRGLGPRRQLRKGPVVLDRDVARLSEVGPVDHDVAGDQQAVATLGPPPVERDDALVGRVVAVAQRLAQRRLRDAVGQSYAGRQVERVSKRGHGIAPDRHCSTFILL